MKRFKHFKGTIYNQLAETIPYEESELETIGRISALHHDTQMVILFEFRGQWMSPDDQSYVLYESTKDGQIWAREVDDFYGYKEQENGEKILRFTPLDQEIPFANEQKYVRPEADIRVPDKYVDLIQASLKTYKKWLKENEKFQELADVAETDANREEALRKGTEHFKNRYAGVLAKDLGDRLSVSQIKNIWEKFMKDEYRGFLNAHLNLTMEQIIRIGMDKFIYVMGWKRPSDVATWHNNKLRVGECCHCQDQFIPMMLQYNNGLCSNCRPLYSAKAIRNFIIRQLHTSERYLAAEQDLLMDFYIMFYHDSAFRKLFVKESETATEMESWKDDVPEWAQRKRS